MRRSPRRARSASAVALAFALVALLGLSCVPCEDTGFEAKSACIKNPMAADQVLEIEVEEKCGGPCSREPSCTAVRDGDKVQVVTSRLECTEDCLPASTKCRQSKVRCALPALPAGDYTVLVPGIAPQVLTTAPGGRVSCFIGP